MTLNFNLRLGLSLGQYINNFENIWMVSIEFTAERLVAVCDQRREFREESGYLTL